MIESRRAHGETAAWEPQWMTAKPPSAISSGIEARAISDRREGRERSASADIIA
jgi:hypothetical protein